MTKFYIKIDEYGNKYYYVNNLLHREDAPAVEHLDGSKYWYKNGKLHREDGPAIEYTNSNIKSWNLNGKRYGYNNEFTNKSWVKFVKTIIFS